MEPWGWALLGVVWGVVSGLVAPSLVRRLPDSVPEIPFAHVPTHAELAAAPRVRVLLAVAGAVAGGLLGWYLAGPWPLLLWLALVPVGLVLAFVDWHTRLLPKKVVLPATLAAIVVVAAVELSVGDRDRLVAALVGLVVVRTLHWVLWFVHAAGLGFGDVRLSALLGLLLGHLGLGPAIVGVYGAFLLHGVPGLVVAIVLRDRAFLKHGVPFGPAMLAGAVLGACWGGPLWGSLAGG